LEFQFEFSKTSQPRTLINATADICGFLNETNNDPLSGWLFTGIRDALPKNILHQCPYFGKLELPNISITPFKNDIYPDGLYNSKFRFFNNRDDKIFLLKLVLEVRRSGLGNAKWK